MMWKCFPSGRKLRNASTMVMCTSTNAVMIAGAFACVKRPAKRPETGRYQGASPPVLATIAASMITSLQSTPRIMQRMNTPSHVKVIRSFRWTSRNQRKTAHPAVPRRSIRSLTHK